MCHLFHANHPALVYLLPALINWKPKKDFRMYSLMRKLTIDSRKLLTIRQATALVVSFLYVTFYNIYLTMHIFENGKTIWDMWGSSLTPQQSTRSPRTEQQSLWTCCQQLEAPWDFSLGSPSSVEWRFFTLLLKLDGTLFRRTRTKSWNNFLNFLRDLCYMYIWIIDVCTNT